MTKQENFTRSKEPTKQEHKIEVGLIADLWRSHKLQAEAVATSLMDIAYEDDPLFNRAERMLECGDNVSIKWYNGKRVYEAKRCRDKICPLCQWRLSLYRQAVLKQAIMENPDKKYAFVTLTIRNCVASDLRRTINKMNYAWRYMSRRSPWLSKYAGYYRALEITHNADNDTYHPHFHIIAEMKPSTAVDLGAIRDQWKTALDVEYTPICEAHEIKPNGKGDITDAVTEVTRYALAPQMLADADQTVLSTLVEQTHDIKTITAGGTLRKLMNKVKTEKPVEISEHLIARTNLYWHNAEKKYITTFHKVQF